MDIGLREIYNRISKLLLEGYTEEQVVQVILRGEITAKPPSELKAREWINAVIEELDLGSPNKLFKARLQDLYRRAVDKGDMKTALTILKELQSTGEDTNKEITVKFIK